LKSDIWYVIRDLEAKAKAKAKAGKGFIHQTRLEVAQKPVSRMADPRTLR